MYESIEAAIAAAPATFQGLRSIHRLGSKVVALSDDGAFYLRHPAGYSWSPMRDVTPAGAQPIVPRRTRKVAQDAAVAQ